MKQGKPINPTGALQHQRRWTAADFSGEIQRFPVNYHDVLFLCPAGCGGSKFQSALDASGSGLVRLCVNESCHHSWHSSDDQTHRIHREENDEHGLQSFFVPRGCTTKKCVCAVSIR